MQKMLSHWHAQKHSGVKEEAGTWNILWEWKTDFFLSRVVQSFQLWHISTFNPFFSHAWKMPYWIFSTVNAKASLLLPSNFPPKLWWVLITLLTAEIDRDVEFLSTVLLRSQSLCSASLWSNNSFYQHLT